MRFFDVIDFFGPYFLWPSIPKVSISDTGFSINNRQVSLDEIISVFYRNRYSLRNTIFFLIGSSMYEILTKTGRIYFFGEHYQLSDFFDNHLERVDRVESKVIGLISRWKQPSGIYQLVSIRDYISQNVFERLDKKELSVKWVMVVITVAVMIFITFIIWFIWALIPK